MGHFPVACCAFILFECRNVGMQECRNAEFSFVDLRVRNFIKALIRLHSSNITFLQNENIPAAAAAQQYMDSVCL